MSLGKWIAGITGSTLLLGIVIGFFLWKFNELISVVWLDLMTVVNPYIPFINLTSTYSQISIALIFFLLIIFLLGGGAALIKRWSA